MQTSSQNTIQPGNGLAEEGASNRVDRVAWQFVVQYYTHMNNKPDQLHRFYTKNSHYLYGVEGEETDLHQGQAAIHKKFVEIKFEDCKVFVHSVDAQPSANNGIFVHVIGEMTNRGEPWKKFVQGFFLAEQPNGYFVLNDNFRFLKEEDFEDDDEGEDAPTGQTATIPQEPPQPPFINPHTNGFHHPSTTTPTVQPVAPVPVPAHTSPAVVAPVEAPAPVEPVVEPPPRPATPEPVEVPAPIVPDVVEPEPEPVATPPPSHPSPAAVSRKTPSPAPPSPAAPAAEPSRPSAPTSASPIPPASHPPPPAATPAAPPVPKTWASLAATNSSKWGQNVAQEAKGLSAPSHPTSVAAPPSQPRERPAVASGSGAGAGTTGGDPSLQPGGVGPRNIPPSQQHPAYAAALAVTTPLCFIKGVTENIPQAALEQLLTARFGPIKECEIVRSKACAFLEFKSTESAKKAIIASLQVQAGGEGGLKLDEEKYGPHQRIVVETRKERGDRPTPRPRVMTGDGGGRGAPTGYNQGSNPGGGPGFNPRGRGGVRGRGDGTRGGRA